MTWEEEVSQWRKKQWREATSAGDKDVGSGRLTRDHMQTLFATSAFCTCNGPYKLTPHGCSQSVQNMTVLLP